MSNANQHGFRLSAKHDRDLIEELKKYEKSREKTDRIKDLMRKGLELERLIATGQVHLQPAPYSHPPYAAHTPYMYAAAQPVVPPAPPSEAQAAPPQAPVPQAPATTKQPPSEAPQQPKQQEKQEAAKEVTFRMEPPKPVIKEEAKPKEPEPAPLKQQAEAPKPPSEEDQKAELMKRLMSNFD